MSLLPAFHRDTTHASHTKEARVIMQLQLSRNPVMTITIFFPEKSVREITCSQPQTETSLFERDTHSVLIPATEYAVTNKARKK